MDETNGDICDDLTGTRFAEIAEIAVIRIGLRREPPNKQGFPAVFFSQPTFLHSEEIVVVVEKLLEAGSRSVRQFDFHLLRRP
jgi:hypothetical protein